MNGENVQQQNQARRRSTFWATWVTPKFQSNQISNHIYFHINCINMIRKKISLIKYKNINLKRENGQFTVLSWKYNLMIQPAIIAFSSAEASTVFRRVLFGSKSLIFIERNLNLPHSRSNHSFSRTALTEQVGLFFLFLTVTLFWPKRSKSL